MQGKLFPGIMLGFLGGVFVASLDGITISFIGLVFLVSIAFILVSLLGVQDKKKFLLIAIFLVSFCFGLLRFYVKDVNQNKNLLDNFIGQNVTISGVVSEEVDRRETSQRLIIFSDEVTLFGYSYDIQQKILVSTELFPKYYYGDRVLISGKIDSPENFITDVGKEFDYINYLRKDGIYYTMSFVDVEKISSLNGSLFKTKILKLKDGFLESIKSIIPEPNSALVGGLLLGTKQSLGDKLEKSFVDTGLIHVVVLSGYNVTIIAEAILKILSFVSVLFGIYVGSFAVFVFVIMTGASATVVRAGIMAILALLARATGRTSEITRALIFAAVIMVLHNPYILMFDISFQLSFIATLGLIYVAPIFKKWFKFLPDKFGIREVVSSTIGVQAFVLPFILYKIGNLSIVAPITNAIVLPFVPVTMLLGFLTGFLGMFSHLIAMPFGFFANALLSFEIFIVETFASFSFASVQISNFPFIIVLLVYIAIVFYLIRYYKSHE